MRIGPYRIENKLGEGGMGVVYRATDGHGRPVALKVLSKLEGAEIERFEREGAIRIEDPRIVRIFGSGRTAEGVPWIALELLHGESLARSFARGLPSIEEAIRIGIETCRALEAVHAKGLIHRDIKPNNIFLEKNGALKLLDFGIARDLARRTRLTTTGAVIGTPAYLSPEQACAEKHLDATTDLWSLGALLYEALTGRPPFERESSVATILAVVGEELVPFSIAAPEVPFLLANAIERALAKKREKRFPSATSFRLALEAALEAGREEANKEEHATHLPILPGEERIVVLLLAEGVRDPGALEASIRSKGGLFLPISVSRALGLFGAENWMGDEVHAALAAAFEARAAANHLAVSSGHASAELSGEALHAAELAGRLPIEGVAIVESALRLAGGELTVRPVRDGVYEALGAAAAETPAASGAADRKKLIGRDRELKELARITRAAVEEKRAFKVVVCGEPGSGKSRLRREGERELRRFSGSRILSARAASHQRYVSRALLASLLRMRAREGALREGWPRIDGASLADRQRAVRRLCAEAFGVMPAERLRGHVEAIAPFIGALLSVKMPSTVALDAAKIEPRLMSDRIRLALFDWLDGVTSARPLGLFAENLEWVDQASLDLLEETIARSQQRPLLVLFTAPAEYESAFSRDALRLELPPLTEADIAAMVEELAGTPLPASSLAKIVEKSGGNPLFVEQLVLALKEQGVLHSPRAELPLPISVAATIQARLDLLSSGEREILKLASVLGRPFTRERLRALGFEVADSELASLRDRGFLASRGAEMWLSSTLVREVAYKMIGEKVRVELHKRAATLLAMADDATSAEVARHFELARAGEIAAVHYANAVRDAALRGDSADVLRLSDRALALGASKNQLFDLYMARADALRFLGRRGDQGAELARALELSKSPTAIAKVLAERALLEARTKGAAAALPAFEQAVNAAKKTGDRDLSALAIGRWSAQLVTLGRLDDASRALAETEQLARGGTLHLRGLVAGWRAQLASARGELAERRRAFAEAAALYREAGDIRLAVSAETNLADTYNRFGAHAEAEEALRIAIQDTRRVGHRLMEGYATLNLAYALMRLQRIDEALVELRNAALIASALGEPKLAVLVRVYRARALLLGGRGGSVLAVAEEAVSEAVRAQVPAFEAAALAIAAEAALAKGSAELADSQSARAMQILERLRGIEEDEAEVYLSRARALEAVGKKREARAVLESARRRVHEIAEKIGDGSTRRRFLEDVAAHRALFAAT